MFQFFNYAHTYSCSHHVSITFVAPKTRVNNWRRLWETLQFISKSHEQLKIQFGTTLERESGTRPRTRSYHGNRIQRHARRDGGFEDGARKVEGEGACKGIGQSQENPTRSEEEANSA